MAGPPLSSIKLTTSWESLQGSYCISWVRQKHLHGFIRYIEPTFCAVAFEPVFRAQASDELLAEFGELAAKRGILGYARTMMQIPER